MDKFVEEFREVQRLETDLRQFLARVPAPEGFEDRLMARLAERERPKAKPVSRMLFGSGKQYGAWWAGIAAALLLSVGGGDALHVRHERQQREAAAVQAQMDMAMQLTSHALNEVQIGIVRSPAGRFAQLWNGTEK